MSQASPETQPNLAALLLDTTHIQPGSQSHQCVGGNTVHLATWSACTVPGPPQESLVRNETRISLPAKPSLTRTTLGQLCAAPWASQSQPAATRRLMGRRTIGLASSGLGRVWPAGISLSHCALATPVAGRAQCTPTRSPGVQCFL